MNIEELRNYCLSLPGVTEDFPFDEVTLVFKVGGKMFLLTGLDGDFSINVKCDPERAIQLREQYAAVRPGYHMSKKHWNTVDIDGSVADSLIVDWINHSYELVFGALPKRIRDSIHVS
ncbi:MmcQ/YjbR family DNA-binding protein [Alkaliflexus imshenetskii]|jgi:predicted DNA-binding protein (MmcQ/YjbR family)|nr:MmcQ/YjbR family DNA-binding protein [Alkaliflexus imshenetskii]